MKNSTDNKQKKSGLVSSQLSLQQLNKVTSLSKVLAAVLFISLPFVGFALGFVSAGGILPIGG
jgi:hypothetical protein